MYRSIYLVMAYAVTRPFAPDFSVFYPRDVLDAVRNLKDNWEEFKQLVLEFGVEVSIEEISFDASGPYIRFRSSKNEQFITFCFHPYFLQVTNE